MIGRQERAEDRVNRDVGLDDEVQREGSTPNLERR